ncbi:MAG: VOC family protein [Longimicrobiales bacterium]
MGLSEKELGGIANIGLPIGPNNLLMGTDVPPAMGAVNFGNNFYIALETDTEKECDTVFAKLAEGGSVEMEPQATAWAEKYGSLEDRFGVHWMVMYTGNVQFG